MGVHMGDFRTAQEPLDQSRTSLPFADFRIHDQRLAVVSAQGQQAVAEGRRQFIPVTGRLPGVPADEDRTAGPVGRGRVGLVGVMDEEQFLPFANALQGDAAGIGVGCVGDDPDGTAAGEFVIGQKEERPEGLRVDATALKRMGELLK